MENKYSNLLIIYYSGTGNSKKVSEWIQKEANTEGLNTHVASYHQFKNEDVTHFKGKTLIGFFSATHGFNMPHSMLRFLFLFKLFPGSDVFVGNTRAGMKLWKLFMPGLSGIAMYFPALILFFKGYKIKAMYPVDLPSNWISLHPGLRQSVISSMVTYYETLTRNFAQKILSGKRVFLKSFVLFPLDMFVAPIALGYYFVGRFILAKTFIANYNCNNCGQCMQQCPTKSIVLHHNRPYWKFSCESCMKCMNYCPQRAIETAHSMVFVLLFILIVFINPWLSESILGFLKENALGSSWLAYESIYFILQWVVALMLFYVCYKLLHNAMRFPRINKMITYTSLTSFAFWRRYKMPKNV